MSLTRPIATSFNGGELSPRMGGRVDTAVYAVGVDTAENFIPTVEGAIVKRPGFEYIEPSAPGASWLSEFRFNLTQDYVIEWSDRRLRFYTNGIRIETSPGVPYEVEVPYSASEAPFVSTQQSYDRLYMAHASHPPARLTRTSGSTFLYEVLTLTNGPFTDENIDNSATVVVHTPTAGVIAGGGKRIDPNEPDDPVDQDQTPTGTSVVASKPIFLPGHVGALFRIEAQDFSTIPAWEAGIDGVNVGTIQRSDGKAYTALTSGRTGTIQPIHDQGTEWDGTKTGTDINGKGPYGIQWAYRHDRFGVAQITSVSPDGMTAGITVVRPLPDSLTSVPSYRWAHGAFSAAEGWPNVVIVYAGRLIFFKNFEMLASVSGDYLNHSAFTSSGTLAADLAFRRTLATEDPVLWAVGDRRIIVGTASLELAIGALNPAAALSGDNIEAVPQSFYGSDAVFPIQIGTAGIFVQRGGRKLRQAEYSFGTDRYEAQNMTVWCRHITRGGIAQLTFQKEPEELLLGVRGDGQLVVHPHAPEQQIKGFARIVHGGGSILSATCISNTAGDADELWVLVRYPDGNQGVERMAPWRDDDDPVQASFFVDSGTTALAGVGQTHFTGATQLAGMAVAVLADGGVVPGVTVSADGSFDIPASAIPNDRPYVITVGVPFTATVVSLRPEIGGLAGGTTQGRKKRVVRLALRLLATSGIRIGVPGGKLDTLINRATNDYMDAAIPLFTGDFSAPVSASYDRDGKATFVSADPLPATIVAAFPKIDVNDD